MINLEVITKGFEYSGKFLSKDDLMDLLSGYSFKDFNELINYLEDNDSNYIGDNIFSLSDSKVDIYYYALREWAVDNYRYIEEAMDEFGMPEKFDFHKFGMPEKFDFHRCIAIGQFYAYNNEFYSLVNEFKSYIEDNYKF